ncbi:MAG: hypothetical protein IIA83_03735 [Thaumarchaeota archaeon]|nr:hypothetical protein [Nitrososphaerota archaeon]
MVRQRQQVLTNRQLETLYSLAVDGRKTKSQLSAEFEIKYPSINGTMKILEDKDLIKIAKKEQGVGKPKLFYELTDLGIKSLSKDNRITLERFWKIAFFIFDRKTNLSIKFLVQDFFSNYEKSVLGYDLRYTPVKWSIILDSFDLLHKPTKLSPEISIFYSLGINGMMSKQDLFSYLKKTRNKIIIKSKNIQYRKILEDIVSGKLVMKIEKNNVVKYRISILGLILLLTYLHENQPKVSTRKQSQDFNSEIKQIFKNSKIIIPQISNSWDELDEMIKGSVVIQFFKWITNDFMPNSSSIQLNGVKELLVIERIMGETNRHIIERESRMGFKVINELFKEGQYPEGKPSEVYDRLLFLSILSGYAVENQEKFLRTIKRGGPSLDLAIENSIANRICFEFFTYFIDWIIMDKNRLVQMKERDSPISEYFSLPVKKWNEFHKNNRKFRIWYYSWIEEIRKFEEKNLKLLKEKDFLKV